MNRYMVILELSEEAETEQEAFEQFAEDIREMDFDIENVKIVKEVENIEI